MDLQPKLEKVYNEVDNYTKSYQSLYTQNIRYKNQIEDLECENFNLFVENKELKQRIKEIFTYVKKFFRNLLIYGNELVKNVTTKQVERYYDNDDFTEKDVINIAVNTTKEDELFDYIGYENYYRPKYSELDDNYKKNKNKDFDLSL